MKHFPCLPAQQFHSFPSPILPLPVDRTLSDKNPQKAGYDSFIRQNNSLIRLHTDKATFAITSFSNRPQHQTIFSQINTELDIKFPLKMSNYKLLSEIKINDEIPVRKYLFVDSGIKVYIAQVSSPVTNSYKALGKNIFFGAN